MTCHQGRARIFSATCLLVAMTVTPIVRAVDITYDGPNGGFWSDNVNWSNDVNGEPLAEFGEQAIINNGATVIVNTDHSAFGTSTGGVLLGVSGSTGGLEIASTGNLTIRLSEFDFNNLQMPGNLEIGRAGRGYVTVQGGGTLAADHILLGGATTAPESKLQVGNTSGLTATVTSNGETSLRRTTEIIGPNVNFTSKGPVTLSSTSTLIANVTSANHSPIKAVASPVTPTTTNATGHAYVDGTLRMQVAGATFLGQSWNIIEATTAIHGSFSSIDASGVTLPSGGKGIQTRIVNGGIGKQLQAVVEQMLTLQVNRTTGAVAIRNTSPSAGGLNNVSFSGYQIQSQYGSLNGAGWNSLDDQNVSGANVWLEAPPTATSLGELRPSAGGTTLNGNTSLALGTAFSQVFPAFGTPVNDDISFEYTTSDGVRQGLIELTGQEVFNNLIVRVDPTTGMAQLRNDSPHTIAIEGYSIFSPTNQLNVAGWNSLDDQNVSPNVVEAAPTAGVLSELVTAGTISLNGFQTYSLGTIHPVAGTQNLTFEFLMDGAADSQDGIVSYGPLYTVGPATDADFDNDSDVDGNDFLIWQRGVGVGNNNATGDADGNGLVNGADLTAWRGEFGPASTVAAGAIPEPSTALLALLAGGFFWRSPRGKRGPADETSAAPTDSHKRSESMIRSQPRTGLISAVAVMLAACGLAASTVQAADVLLITRPAEFGAPDDQLLLLLKSFGHNIVNEGDIRLDQADYRAAPPTAAELANVDAIVLSRANNSGNFDDSADEINGWNAIATPIISMNPQLARGGHATAGNNRWGWVNMDTTTTVDNQPAPTSYDPFPNPSHPFVAGRSTDVFFNGETIDYLNRDGSWYPTGSTVVANMTVGVDITAAIVDIPAGATLFATGQGAPPAPLGGRRVLLQMVEYPDTHDVFRMTTNGGQILNQIINSVTLNAPSSVPGDVDGDGIVENEDFTPIRNNFGMAVSNRNQGDLNGNSIVDLQDLVLWREAFIAATVAQAAIPEPAGLALALTGMVAVLAKRRRN